MIGGACGGGPKKGRCDVKVYSPDRSLTQVVLLNTGGEVIDSTLRVINDSITFSRTDTALMPYVATLRLINPEDSLNMIYMPLVIEGGVVRMDLGDRISLSGTSDNEALYKFLKAKNSFMSKVNDRSDHNAESLRRDYSKFFSDQIVLNKGNVVGEYLMQTYGQLLTPEDYGKVKEWMKN